MTKLNKNNGLTVQQVAEIAAANEPKVFNMVAALEAAESAPLRANRASAARGLVSVVREILTAATAPLAMSQIQAAYFAGIGEAADKKTAKKVYEAVFQHSDACKNKSVDTSKAIFTRDADGKYSIKK